MEEELHITGIQYNWIGVFFIAGYLTWGRERERSKSFITSLGQPTTMNRMQVPSNVLLSRLRPSVYLPILELIWCILTLSMAFVQNVYQVYPIRLMLGLAEAGFYPGVCLSIIVVVIWRDSGNLVCDTSTSTRLYSCLARGTQKLSSVHVWLFWTCQPHWASDWVD